MAAATRPHLHESREELVQMRKINGPEFVTLLELVVAVSASANNDREVVTTILSLLSKGRVKLKGNFRDEPVDSFND